MKKKGEIKPSRTGKRERRSFKEQKKGGRKIETNSFITKDQERQNTNSHSRNQLKTL